MIIYTTYLSSCVIGKSLLNIKRIILSIQIKANISGKVRKNNAFFFFKSRKCLQLLVTIKLRKNLSFHSAVDLSYNICDIRKNEVEIMYSCSVRKRVRSTRVYPLALGGHILLLNFDKFY